MPDKLPQIANFQTKIEQYWPEWVTTGGVNNARNYMLAKMFYECNLELGTTLDNVHPYTAHEEMVIAAGVLQHPRSITGVRIFFIDKTVLVSPVPVENPKRMLKLHYSARSGSKHLWCEINRLVSTSTTLLEDNAYALKFDNYPSVWVLVNYAKLPDYDVVEEVEIIPLYTPSYMQRIAENFGLPTWHNETDASLRGRVLYDLQYPAVSPRTLLDRVEHYCEQCSYELRHSLHQYREHFKSYFVVGENRADGITNKGSVLFSNEYIDSPPATTRSFKKDQSDNINQIHILLTSPRIIPKQEWQIIIKELSELMEHYRPQGAVTQVIGLQAS